MAANASCRAPQSTDHGLEAASAPATQAAIEYRARPHGLMAKRRKRCGAFCFANGAGTKMPLMLAELPVYSRYDSRILRSVDK